jgi:hypothetical protein
MDRPRAGLEERSMSMIQQCLCTAFLLLMGMASAGHAAPPAPVSDGAPRAFQIVTTARAGAVAGKSYNSDEFIWRLFAQFAAPVAGARPATVQFETWASDLDTFKDKPVWPRANAPKKFQGSKLRQARTHGGGPVDVACKAPPIPGLGAFPTEGKTPPCIAEEVRRNRPQFDYLLKNRLHTTQGRAAAFASGLDVQMPLEAVSVKGDWVPLGDLLAWLPELGSVERIRLQYYTGISDNVEYALVSMHVSSRQNANWVWGTFEHQKNPGRCDDLGCFDSYGASLAEVAPERRKTDSQYGDCAKTPALEALMRDAGLSAVWKNYCLKSTQVDYVAADGTPSALGNSVIERIVGGGSVVASSCIGCHAYASFDKTGAPSAGIFNMLPYNPTGPLIPAVLKASRQFDFSWGLVNQK